LWGGILVVIKRPVIRQPRLPPRKKPTVIKRRVKKQPKGIPREQPTVIKRRVEEQPRLPIKKEEPKKYSPGQIILISKLRQIKTMLEYSRMKRRIDPQETYLVHESYWGRGRKGYRHVKGRELHKIIDRERMQHLKKETETIRKVRKLPSGTRIVETEEGYEIKLTKKGAEEIAAHKMEKEYEKAPEPVRFAGKWAGTTLWGTTSPEFWRRTIFEGVESGKQYIMSQQYAAYQSFVRRDVAGFAARIATAPLALDAITFGMMGLIGKGLKVLKPLAGILPRTTKFFKYTLVGTIATMEGTRITGKFMESPEKGAFASLETGKRIYFAYKGLKWGMQSKPVSLKAIQEKIDFSKVPFLKQVKSFMGYHADVRMAKGIRAVGQQLYRPLPAYLSSKAYGASHYTTTLEQMKGTLFRSGWRGADPLGASAWAYYRSVNVKPILVSRMFKGYTITKIGKVIKTYDLFGKKPLLETGVMPKEFTTSQIAIRVYAPGKSFTSFKSSPSLWEIKDASRSFLKPIKPSKDIVDVGYRYVTVKQLPDMPLSFKHKFQYPKLETKAIRVDDKSLVTLWKKPVGATPIQTRFKIPPLVFTLQELKSLEEGLDYTYAIPKMQPIQEMKLGQLKKFRLGEIGEPKYDFVTSQDLIDLTRTRQDVRMDQAQIPLSATVPMLGLGSLLGLKQLQQQLQIQKYAFPRIHPLRYDYPGITGTPKPPIPPPTTITPIPPVTIDDLLRHRKKKKYKLGLDLLDLKYHEREHKVLKLEDIIG